MLSLLRRLVVAFQKLRHTTAIAIADALTDASLAAAIADKAERRMDFDLTEEQRAFQRPRGTLPAPK